MHAATAVVESVALPVRVGASLGESDVEEALGLPLVKAGVGAARALRGALLLSLCPLHPIIGFIVVEHRIVSTPAARKTAQALVSGIEQMKVNGACKRRRFEAARIEGVTLATTHVAAYATPARE
jgi:hypothetical protein